jgi:hypothetical protein
VAAWAKGAFSLTTPTQEESEAEPLQNFLPERHYVPLLEVLATVNRYSSFLDEFQHWQQRHRRGRPSPKTFYAGLIGIGCTIGSRKMGLDISLRLTNPNWNIPSTGTFRWTTPMQPTTKYSDSSTAWNCRTSLRWLHYELNVRGIAVKEG